MSTPVTVQNKIQLLQEEINQLQNRLKAMYAGDLSPESRLNGYKVVTREQQKRIKQLQAELEVVKEDLAMAIMTGNYQTHAQINSKLQAELEKLKEFIEETDNVEAYKQWCNCNKP